MKRAYELAPCDSHKSFYGKAIVAVDDNGNQTLYSYGTRIITMHPDGSLTRHWSGWSATTGRHVISFCGLYKSEYEKLPVER